MKKRKFLIIDEEALFTDIVKLSLELGDNDEVCVENNPSSAVATALKCSPDAILLDAMMMERDGGAFYRQFKTEPRLKHIPIVFVTETVRRKEVDENSERISGKSRVNEARDKWNFSEACRS